MDQNCLTLPSCTGSCPGSCTGSYCRNIKVVSFGWIETVLLCVLALDLAGNEVSHGALTALRKSWLLRILLTFPRLFLVMLQQHLNEIRDF